MGNIASRSHAADNNQNEAVKAIEDASDKASPATMSSSNKDRESKRKEKKKDKEDETIIPIDIVEDLLRRIHPKEAVGLSIVCKHWRSPALAFGPTPGITPWKVVMMQSQFGLHFLMLSITHPGFYMKLKSLNFFNLAPGNVECVGSWHGWLVLHRIWHLLSRSEQLILFNPFSGAQIDSPLSMRISLVYCITVDPTTPGCIVIARSPKYLLLWRPGDTYWTKEVVQSDLTRSECFVRFKEQSLLLNTMHDRFFSLEFFPFRFKELGGVFDTWTVLGIILVESEGELLGIHFSFLILTLPMQIRVFRLDWSTMTFVQIKGLGVDRAVFLSKQQGFSVSAREARCAGNCIYFFDEGRRNLSCYVYSFEDCDSSYIPLPRLLYGCSQIKGETWIFPPTIVQ